MDSGDSSGVFHPDTFRFPSGYTLTRFSKLSSTQRVTVGRRDKLLFAYYYLPHHYLVEFGCPPHIQSIFRLLSKRYKQTCIVSFRGSSKSTATCLVEPLFDTVFRLSPFSILVSESEEFIDEHLDTLRKELEGNERIIGDFGTFSPHFDQRKGGERWRTGDLTTSTGARLRAFGINQRMRGLKFGPYRPFYVCVDDPESDDNTKNPEALRRNERKVTKTLLPALDPQHGRIVVDGNYIVPHCLVEKLHRHSQWHSVKFDAENHDRTHATWPERFPLEELRRIEAGYHELNDFTTYNLEYLNLSVGGHDRGFRDEDRRFWEGDCRVSQGFAFLHVKQVGRYAEHTHKIEWDPEWKPQYIPVILFGGKDPSFTEEKRSDDTCDFITAIDSEGRHWHVEYLKFKTKLLDEQADQTIAMMKKYYPRRYGIEINNGQEWIVQTIKHHAEWATLRGKVSIVPLDHRGNKHDRIIGRLQPMEKQGKLFIRWGMMDLVYERDHFGPKLTHDDVSDAEEMAVSVAYKPSQMTLRESAAENTNAARRYYKEPEPANWMVL